MSQTLRGFLQANPEAKYTVSWSETPVTVQQLADRCGAYLDAEIVVQGDRLGWLRDDGAVRVFAGIVQQEALS